MEKLILKASSRAETGKNVCKQMRKAGLIPGIIYKGGEKGFPITLDSKELWKSLHTDAGEHAVVTLNIAKGTDNISKTVIAKEVQHDPLTDKIVHIDFLEISLMEVIKVKIPVHVKGESPGVAEGGVVNQVLWEIEIECKAKDIPENIEVNISELNIGDAIHLKDVSLPAGVQALDDPEQLLVGVNPPHVEEEETEEESEDTAEPEVVKKGKKEDEGEEEASEEKEGE